MFNSRTLAAVLAITCLLQWDTNRANQEELRSLKKAGSSTGVQQDSLAKGPVEPVSASEHRLGPANAQLTVVEYSDYECPYCREFQPVMQNVRQAYGDKVAWVFRQYPLTIHAGAQQKAEAAECVADQAGNEGFWKFTDAVYSTGVFPVADLPSFVANLGFNEEVFRSCLNSGRTKVRVDKDLASGNTAGVQGTPTSFIMKKDGTNIPIDGALPLSLVRQQIDKALD